MTYFDIFLFYLYMSVVPASLDAHQKMSDPLDTTTLVQGTKLGSS